MEEEQSNKVGKGLGKGSAGDMEEEPCSKFAKGLGKGSTATSSAQQPEDLPSKSSTIPGFHLGPLPSSHYNWWEQ